MKPGAPSSTTANQVLVVGPSWVGDMVIAQSLFKALARTRPGVCIDVLAPPWSLPILARMPEVRHAVKAPFRHGRLDISVRYKLGRRLAGIRYRQAIVLPNSWKSALVPFVARIPHRTGYLGEQRRGLLNDIRRLDRQRLPTTVQRFVALASERDQALPTMDTVPTPGLVIDQRLVARALAAVDLTATDRQVLVLCPGAEFGPAKQWPPEHYAEIACRYLALGWAVWLMGSDNDSQMATQIMALSDSRCVNLVGRTTLEQAIDLMSLADLVISNDSGLMHVAAALDRPLVAVYGSTDPTATPPLNKTSAVVWLGLDCSPCLQRHCPLGHLKCLREISPDLVMSTASGLRSGTGVADGIGKA